MYLHYKYVFYSLTGGQCCSLVTGALPKNVEGMRKVHIEMFKHVITSWEPRQ